MNTQNYVNVHCGYTTVQPTSGRGVPTGKTLTNQKPTTMNHSSRQPFHQPTRTPAFMLEAPQAPTGFGPTNQPSEDINNPSLFNSPTCGAGEEALLDENNKCCCE